MPFSVFDFNTKYRSYFCICTLSFSAHIFFLLNLYRPSNVKTPHNLVHIQIINKYENKE